MKSFEELISEAESWEFTGWDFSSLRDRWVESSPPWNYSEEVSAKLRSVNSLLDLGTGGGELLSSLHPIPERACATEGYLPNVPIAKQRLKPLGIELIRTWCDDNDKLPQRGRLPFRDQSIDMVIDRHESFIAREVFKVLRLGGIFITQQVGSSNTPELNKQLHANHSLGYSAWNMSMAIRQLVDAGFRIMRSEEAMLSSYFSDIGAVVCYLKSIPWQIPNFSVEKYRSRLKELHEFMVENGGLKATSSRFYIEAAKS